jgi:hypothetical protein
VFRRAGLILFLKGKPELKQICDLKKSPCIAARAFYLAPRPGLEPGTYGLTEIQARQKHI